MKKGGALRNARVSRGRGKARIPVLGLAVIVLTLGARSAEAFQSDGATWPSGTFHFRVNEGSFATNLSGLSLTAAEAEAWVTLALSNWSYRTGANLTFVNDGATTAMPNCLNTLDFVNEVYVMPGCKPNDSPPCSTAADTMQGKIGSSMVETDICLYGGAYTWRVAMQTFPSGSMDLVSTLHHEFGHALGLDHVLQEDYAVMSPGNFDTGNTVGRVPMDDDTKGIRSLYPSAPALAAYWREMSGASPSAEHGPLPFGHMAHAMAGMGDINGPTHPYIVATRLDPTGSRIEWQRTPYPLTTSSSWGIRYLSANTWRPPSVAGALYFSNTWVSAYTPTQNGFGDCPGIKLLVSTDGFDSGQIVTLGNGTECTMHEPTLTFDYFSSRFVLFYVKKATSEGNQADNGRLFVRTSLNGTTWTAPQDTAQFVFDAVEATCGYCAQTPCYCVIAHAKGGTSTPNLWSRKFSVDGSGVVTLSDGATEWSYSTLRSVAVGVREGPTDNIYILGFSPGSGADLGQGGQTAFWETSSQIPFTSFTVGEVPPHTEPLLKRRVTLASNPFATSAFFFYTR